jgi:hypothetical protein
MESEGEDCFVSIDLRCAARCCAQSTGLFCACDCPVEDSRSECVERDLCCISGKRQ